MITEKEIEAVKLSATKKDFYQIWNELLDTADKLSERWSPAATVESDPGVVLLKVLTACADKLNYTVDKNILECFMPSASQEESMRKLCDMLGYNMKYYQSATTQANISYIGTEYDLGENYYIIIPKFTNIKNTDEDINYVTLDEIQLQNSITSANVDIAEGQYVEYDNITLDQLDDEQRYYLPETQIAENGIFLTSADDETITYKKVNNLNTQIVETYCYKFGYDSKKMTPYIQFPSDISSIIGSGIKFGFLRTNGINGNVSARTLNVLDTSTIIMTDAEGNTIEISDEWFTAKNIAAATNGTNKETLNNAYQNFKHTIGTFNTLVTCRDYMNKIYQLTFGDITEGADTTPLVSNVIVSDIRDDINRTNTICSFNEQGTTYLSRPKYSSSKKRIDCFDLILYPFGTVYGTNTKDEYINSFRYTDENVLDIKAGIADQKTISHNILRGNESKKGLTDAENDNIACIKNYETLRATVTTTRKVGKVEEAAILNNIYTAIYKNFNMRTLDFGEKIDFDTILEVIKNADTRVKNVSLDTSYETKFAKVDGTECSLADDVGKGFYNDLAVSNVLAGRIPLFNYDTTFTPALNESGNTLYPQGSNIITNLKAYYEPSTSSISYANPLTLKENEVIQFRAPNFNSYPTYPAYVNYYLILKTTITTAATPATMLTLYNALNGNSTWLNKIVNDTDYMNKHMKPVTPIPTATADYYKKYFIWLFTRTGSGTTADPYVYTLDTVLNPLPSKTGDVYSHYYMPFTSSELGIINSFVKNEMTYSYTEEGTTYTANREGLFKILAADLSRVKGQYVDENLNKYTLASVIDKSAVSGVYSDCYAFYNMYVQDTHSETSPGSYTADGLGLDGELNGIEANEEYQLKDAEYLLINYTKSSTDDNGNTTSTVINECYGPGEIIKPNFALNDSKTVHDNQGKSWAKKTGFDFKDTKYGGNPEGMFSNDANQQIEIREQVIVNLGLDEEATSDSTNIFVYWLRNDDSLKANSATTAGEIEFEWDEEPTTDTSGNTWYQAYTLKDGEYFFYTDKNKTDLAYYGSGSTIRRTNSSLTIYKKISEDSITAEDIVNYGLVSSFPWISKLLGRDTDTDPLGTIKIYEYQYINLTASDKLLAISFATTGDALKYDWQKVKSATYRFNGNEKEESLPKISLTSSTNSGWQVRSLLQYNVGPNLTQILHENDKIEIYGKASSSATSIELLDTIQGETAGISIKTNELKQQLEQDLDVTQKYESGEWVLNEDFKIKKFKQEIVKFNDIALDIGNLDNGLTQTSLANLEDGNSIKLYLSIPSDDYGLLMFFVKNINDTGNDPSTKAGHPYIALNNVGASIFSKNGGWWTNFTEENKDKLTDTSYWKETKAPAAYDISTTYAKYALVSYNDGTTTTYYVSKQNSNKGQDLTNTTYWKDLGTTITDYAASTTYTEAFVAVKNSSKYYVSITGAHYYLHYGINIVKITATAGATDTTLEIFAGDNKAEDTLTFSNLDLVYSATDKEVNPDISYQKLDAGATISIFDKIKEIDTDDEFYYNNIIDNSNLINVNSASGVILSSPEIWYDYNNIGNKFVITEIDATKLADNIVIENTSKL